jgi:polyisoprenoid-binding protein YceI
MIMKKLVFLSILIFAGMQLLAQQRYITRDGHARIFSTTVAEDITADNYSVTATIDTQSGEMVFFIPVQSFEFEKALMQRHFNQRRFMHSSAYPRITFHGKINNLAEVDWSRDGNYDVTVTGDLTIRDVTKTITEKGTIEVRGDKILARSVFLVRGIEDYNVGKPSGSKRNNVADDIEVTFMGTFEQE